ncbi:MAG: alpha-1,4-glucan--maltose-1-phosphate maltosyltransferase [Lautropia sp.]
MRTARPTGEAADHARGRDACTPPERWSRVVVEHVSPQVDAGRFPVKRCVGDRLVVQADAFTDGHDRIRCRLRVRCLGDGRWREVEMRALGNDRWEAECAIESVGRHEYTVAAWVDAFHGWRHDLERRVDARDVSIALKVGAVLVAGAAARASRACEDAGDEVAEADEALRDARADRQLLSQAAQALDSDAALSERCALALSAPLLAAMDRHPDRAREHVRMPALPLVADPPLAGFSAWYELFPRSMSPIEGAHGTLRDVERVVADIAAMGFDVLYLPPIHPIGRIHRKGPNNTLVAGPDDPGSPWAIGSEEGGHCDIHPELGTDEDLRALVGTCRRHGIELALDIAFQCAPDHPWVDAHPQWFQRRPDGSVQYAENPPKKYQDIYPLHFENDDHAALFDALASVFMHWVERGITVFRVDNPHTKPFAFWEWAIARIKHAVPQAIFLSEAFTRPKVMHRLAKLGFSQSYTYFTWRNTREELADYLVELASPPGVEYFRPNFWPNTPDILHEALQSGGRPAFVVRLVLAATMTANYGVYGPAYQHLEREPREPGSEEYRDAEKYQIRRREMRRDDDIGALMAALNRIRRAHPALQQNRLVSVLDTDNPQLFAFGKWSGDGASRIIVVANLDFRWTQSGFVDVPAGLVDVAANEPFEVEDLLSGERYRWNPGPNYVRLSPEAMPVHVLRVQRIAS